jgi:hypothetical protein
MPGKEASADGRRPSKHNFIDYLRRAMTNDYGLYCPFGQVLTGSEDQYGECRYPPSKQQEGDNNNGHHEEVAELHEEPQRPVEPIGQTIDGVENGELPRQWFSVAHKE